MDLTVCGVKSPCCRAISVGPFVDKRRSMPLRSVFQRSVMGSTASHSIAWSEGRSDKGTIIA
eukprot:scaffold261845_cov29-Prasinocladus_malaysianus.AAC.1